MDHEVSVVDVPPQPTAVVAGATTWAEFPNLWGRLLGEVWECLRANGIDRGCRNVMLYRDDVPHVEVGVLVDRPCDLTGRVVFSTLPSGRAATTVHSGAIGTVGAGHDAVLEWCAQQGIRLDGQRWESYGPHHDDPALQWTEIYWRLS